MPGGPRPFLEDLNWKMISVYNCNLHCFGVGFKGQRAIQSIAIATGMPRVHDHVLIVDDHFSIVTIQLPEVPSVDCVVPG